MAPASGGPSVAAPLPPPQHNEGKRLYIPINFYISDADNSDIKCAYCSDFDRVSIYINAHIEHRDVI